MLKLLRKVSLWSFFFHIKIDSIAFTNLGADLALALGKVPALLGINLVHMGNGLGVRYVDRLATDQLHVMFAGSQHRADCGTITAGRALVSINIAGLLLERQLYLQLLAHILKK